jgi:hypothetical protein
VRAGRPRRAITSPPITGGNVWTPTPVTLGTYVVASPTRNAGAPIASWNSAPAANRR